MENMKTNWTELENFRVQTGPYASCDGDMFGAFMFGMHGHVNKTILRTIAADGEETGWEHVSVTVVYQVGRSWRQRAATWQEMSFVKDAFWREDECVVQFHPPRANYVNNHSCCLHLWRKVGTEYETPPEILTGDKSLGRIGGEEESPIIISQP